MMDMTIKVINAVLELVSGCVDAFMTGVWDYLLSRPRN